jgi:hypothetical protein
MAEAWYSVPNSNPPVQVLERDYIDRQGIFILCTAPINTGGNLLYPCEAFVSLPPTQSPTDCLQIPSNPDLRSGHGLHGAVSRHLAGMLIMKFVARSTCLIDRCNLRINATTNVYAASLLSLSRCRDLSLVGKRHQAHR